MGAGKGRSKRAQSIASADKKGVVYNGQQPYVADTTGGGSGSSFLVENENERNMPHPVKRRVTKARDELLSIFSELYYFPYKLLSEDEKRITDPNFNYANDEGRILNEDGDSLRPYTTLYRYCPNMKGNKAHWITTQLRLDHESGDIFVISDVKRPAGFLSRVGVYSIKNCGNDIEKALQVAQGAYDSTFAQFKTSKAGQKAEYAPSREWKDWPKDKLQPLDYTPEVFQTSKDEITAALVDGVQKMTEYQTQKQLQQSQKVEQKAEALNKAKELGYIS